MNELEIKKKLAQLDIDEQVNRKTMATSRDSTLREAAREDLKEIAQERAELTEKLKSLQVGRAMGASK